MAQKIPIWAGSSSFSAGQTPFGLYDTDTQFDADADKVADWCAKRLGYPLTDIELQPINFFACFEEAVTEYGNQLNKLQDKIDKIRKQLYDYDTNENVAPNHDGKAAPFGSGYDKVEEAEWVDESLRDWFKKEDWVRINTSGNIAGPCGTMKKGKATTRCLPRKKAQSLTKAERKATVAKKVRGSKKGKQFVKNTKKSEFKKKK